VSLYRVIQIILLASLDLASIHWLLGGALGAFFYKCGKWFALLFSSHGDQLHWWTVIFKHKMVESPKEHH